MTSDSCAGASDTLAKVHTKRGDPRRPLREIVHDDQEMHLAEQLDDIVDRVAEHYELTPSELLVRSRERRLAEPRQVAMYLMRPTTDATLAQVARAVQRHDHTTVIHACRKIEGLRRLDPQLEQDIDEIMRVPEMGGFQVSHLPGSQD